MIDISEEVCKVFHDIKALYDGCRFRNFSHTTEPGCAIQAAIERGDLSLKRFKPYQKLKVETAFAGNKNTYTAEKEKRFKSIAKINKSNHKK